MSTKNLAMLAMGIAVAFMAPKANATVQITLTNGAITVTITDGGTPRTSAGVFLRRLRDVQRRVGKLPVNVSTGIAPERINPYLDLNSINCARERQRGC
jgi:hypothetical protein